MDFLCLSEHEARCVFAALVTLAGISSRDEERLLELLVSGQVVWEALSGRQGGESWGGKLVRDGDSYRLQLISVRGSDAFLAAVNTKLAQILPTPLRLPLAFGPLRRPSALAG